MPLKPLCLVKAMKQDIIGARNAGFDQIYFKPNGRNGTNEFNFTYEVVDLKQILELL
jgi:FMN phosphatase YigB (HAD superfamily)